MHKKNLDMRHLDSCVHLFYFQNIFYRFFRKTIYGAEIFKWKIFAFFIFLNSRTISTDQTFDFILQNFISKISFIEFFSSTIYGAEILENIP
mgnify:CR=1 FL=1